IDFHAKHGDPHKFKFPITTMPNLDFSFSGIKTAFLYFIRKNIKENPNFIIENQADICASIQYTLIQMLLNKLIKAVEQTGIKTIVLAGGVAANQGLRQALTDLA